MTVERAKPRNPNDARNYHPNVVSKAKPGATRQAAAAPVAPAVPVLTPAQPAAPPAASGYDELTAAAKTVPVVAAPAMIPAAAPAPAAPPPAVAKPAPAAPAK